MGRTRRRDAGRARLTAAITALTWLAWMALGGCNEILGNPSPSGLGGSAGAGSGGFAGAATGGLDGLGGLGGGSGGGEPVRLDGPCSTSGERACDDGDAKLTLVCSKGSWVSSGSCNATENCEPLTGVCTDLVPECEGLVEGNRFCSAEQNVLACGPNLVSTVPIETCAGRCVDTGASAVCVPAMCGDGRPQSGEDCDDGDDDNDDDCTEICQPPFCGDGFEQTGEDCDTGGESSSCDEDCTPVVCGDMEINEAADEACDDGNDDNEDACTEICQPPFCGDGLEQTGEACDDGDDDNDDDCTEICQPPFCGDGLEQNDEVCDTEGDTASCDGDCTSPLCGDTYLNAAVGEACESSTQGQTPANSATCDSDCTAPACGDGYVNSAFGIRLLGVPPPGAQGNEACDPATGTTASDAQRALADGPGCDHDCTTPRCGDSYVNAAFGEACDPTYFFPGDPVTDTPTCDRDCTIPVCGDGYQNEEAEEDCDDGNDDDDDDCVGACEDAACGDGYEHATDEECDDGNLSDGDGCDSQCDDE